MKTSTNLFHQTRSSAALFWYMMLYKLHTVCRLAQRTGVSHCSQWMKPLSNTARHWTNRRVSCHSVCICWKWCGPKQSFWPLLLWQETLLRRISLLRGPPSLHRRPAPPDLRPHSLRDRDADKRSFFVCVIWSVHWKRFHNVRDVFAQLSGRIICIAWYTGEADENLVVTGGIDNLRIWSVKSGHAIQRLTLGRQHKNKETIVWAVAVAKLVICFVRFWALFSICENRFRKTELVGRPYLLFFF